MSKTGIANARGCARALVRRLGISAPEHIRIEAIAKRLGARVVETQLDGADAQLVRTGEDVFIMVTDRLTDDGARRFAIAHELGHFVLGHPSMPPHLLSTPPWLRTRGEHERDYEAEANAFASELLMPHALVNRWCDVSPVSLDVAWRIARDFRVSILASARRFAELSPERCAAVFTARRKVVWVTQSATFTREIERGRRVDPDSMAWEFYERGELEDRARPVPADAWLETSVEVDIVEHATASHEFGTVLSLVWIPDHIAARLGMG